MRLFSNQTIPIGLASLTLGVLAGPGQAQQIDVFFTGTIDDPASTGLAVGDEVQGSFSYNSATADSGLGNFPDTVVNLDLFLIDVSESGGFSTFVNQPDGDIFIGNDSFELYYGPDAGQLGDNFGLNLTGSTANFNQSLADATDELVDAGFNALNLFNDDISGFIQNDDTFEEVLFTVDFIEFSRVPEPGSLALLGLGGLMTLRRRR